MKRVLHGLLRFYKLAISPHLGNKCRFYPSCSAYMYEAVEQYGAGKGFWLGIKRLLRCNPFNRGGYDPVP
ncbi:MAG: membrane protein insertion efficiency factor YidD [Defluviitaleaceae bacterium]|nr:membrane protein insertion efficiency factor YidD [Defluviitaleaceae bacterium]MCL2204314.1 membrane protein insertion efficiency factor YidD [Defluviitaleaceae bacterium]MCL2240472.1 membrane protein insertion efficiency factor YidD [Defluviitaleaceae bacterium]